MFVSSFTKFRQNISFFIFLPKWRLNQDIPVVKENVSGDDNEAKLVDRKAGEGGHGKSQAGHL